MCKWFITLIFFLPTAVLAQAVDFGFSYEAYLYGERRNYADSVINLGNEVLNIPDVAYVLDQRAEFKWNINDAKIIFRPRIVSYQQNFKTNTTLKNESKSDSDMNLTDAFYEQYITERVFTTLGLQVYQWGPAEVLNPSNPFFHFNSDQRSLIYKEKGKALVRLNWNTKKDYSFVIMAEPVSNNEAHWISDEKFKPQLAGKFEINWAGTRNFLGLVAGIPDNADFFVGEYFQYEFIDGVSIYADAKHSVNTFFYEPQTQGSLQRMVPSEQNSSISSLVVAGLRYEDALDARVEYIYNSSGYDERTFEKALLAASELSPYLVDNIKRFQKSGLELLSQNYIYFSVRKSEPFDIKDLSLFLRSLTALADSSGVEQFEFDKSVLDWMNIFGQYSAFRGERDTEFKLLDDWKVSLGVKAVY